MLGVEPCQINHGKNRRIYLDGRPGNPQPSFSFERDILK